MDQTTSTSGVRDEAINYLAEQFAEIFEASESDREIIKNNLEKMDDDGLRHELELLNEYYYNVRQAYSGGLSRLRELAEQEEKTAEVANFNF